MTHQSDRLARGEHPLIPAKTICELSGLKYNALRMRLSRGGELTTVERTAIMDCLNETCTYIDWVKFDKQPEGEYKVYWKISCGITGKSTEVSTNVTFTYEEAKTFKIGLEKAGVKNAEIREVET
jgi:hypothetical protein